MALAACKPEVSRTAQSSSTPRGSSPAACARLSARYVAAASKRASCAAAPAPKVCAANAAIFGLGQAVMRPQLAQAGRLGLAAGQFAARSARLKWRMVQKRRRFGQRQRQPLELAAQVVHVAADAVAYVHLGPVEVAADLAGVVGERAPRPTAYPAPSCSGDAPCRRGDSWRSRERRSCAPQAARRPRSEYANWHTCG